MADDNTIPINEILDIIDEATERLHGEMAIKNLQSLVGIQKKNITTKTRPTWDEYFMDIAKLVASRSTCNRRSVGAVAVKGKHILASGYNGSPKDQAHCIDTGCLREEQGIPSGQRHELCNGVHAEQNIICQAAYHGVSLAGATIYCTNQPCSICAKLIVNAGIVRVVYLDGYPDEMTKAILGDMMEAY